MTGTPKWRLMPVLAALALFLAACGGATVDAAASNEADDVTTTVAEEHTDDDAPHEEDEAEHSEDEAPHEEDEAEHSEDEAPHDEAYTFGEPAHAEDADRVIEIDANDDFTFGPEEIAVTAGETITFVVTNTGLLPHDFTLGDEATQDAHEAEMAEMAEMAGMPADEMAHSDPNAVVVAAGETAELTWHFSESGTILMGCHQPGHYAAGMHGTVQVDA